MILVTDGEQRSSLAVVRSLGRAGHSVAVCSASPKPLAGASRFCSASYRVPDASADAEGFFEAVEGIVDRDGVKVVIPITDLSAPIILGLRSSRPRVAIPFPALEAYQAISDKDRITRTAGEMGIPVPRQVVAKSRDVASTAALADSVRERLGAPPYILKPTRSVAHGPRAAQRFSVRTVFTAASLGPELEHYPAEAFPVLIQERVVGPGTGVFLLGGPEGQLLAAFAHRRIREKPPTGGVSVYRLSVPLREDLRRFGADLLERFQWHGVLMLEFKEDASTGTPYLMEANGRFWGSLQLAIDSGIDFPRLLVESALGTSASDAGAYRIGVRSRWLWGDLDHLLWMLRAPGDYRSRHPELPGRLTSLGRFLVPWRPGEHLEVLRASDPLPFVRESAQWFGGLRR